MKKWHSDLLEYRRNLLASSPYESTHYPAIVPMADHLRWLDETSGTDVLSRFGWSWKAWSFWWQDRSFYNLCKNGIFSSALWRLFETGKRKAWSGAREQIYKDNEAAKKQVSDRKAFLKSQENKKDI
jgi:dimethylaniline monooxygenase (N-oxide forming)